MARQDLERQNELEPKRVEFAVNVIQKLGLEIIYEGSSRIDFIYNKTIVMFYPYSGWHTGKSIKDGRGWNKLYDQIKDQ